MIKLNRSNSPGFLTPEKIRELTEEFKSTGNSVWNNTNIKEALLSSSHGKCAYCECSLERESNYMEVEHFEDKKNNPDKVVVWENLLPSCKKCNGYKGSHDVIDQPIINPYVEDPKDHLSLRLYRLRGITEKGLRTIETVNLNHSDRLVYSRFKIGEKLSELVGMAWDRLGAYRVNKDIRSRNKLLSVVEGLLKECAPTENYAASTATILLTDNSFLDLVEQMRLENIWDAELELCFQNALPIVLKYT